ncbi:MAG: PEP-CTERM sorting domain-containing protein [Armatimonadetes bacterium]|nr:PEP-CTERM sorting domain-containing protein [Armatimonadota bacterium]
MKTPLLIALFSCAASSAFAVNDAVGDFISTYTGPPNADVDVVSATVGYDGSDYVFSATMAGVIGSTTGALYVWGFDRGQGTARFSPSIPGTENILFDSVVVMRPDTTLTVTRIFEGGSTNFGAGTVTVSGATLTARVAKSELPNQGLAFDKYTWNLWPRVGTGNNNQISDFAPDHENAAVDVVPEPVTLVALGTGLAAFLRKRRPVR